jgi:hypothetical protein
MTISASEWFENRNQYRLDYPEETGLRAGSWEWVPGQVVAPERVTIEREIVGELSSLITSLPANIVLR